MLLAGEQTVCDMGRAANDIGLHEQALDWLTRCNYSMKREESRVRVLTRLAESYEAVSLF